MPPRYRAIREDEDHDGQAMREGNCGDTGQADTLADNGRCAGADEHKCEGANQLRKELGCNWVEHLDLQGRISVEVAPDEGTDLRLSDRRLDAAVGRSRGDSVTRRRG